MLLPKRQVPEGVEIGDPVEVFLYKDSDDRLIATTHEPKIELGELAVLEVQIQENLEHFMTGDWKRICFCLSKSRL